MAEGIDFATTNSTGGIARDSAVSEVALGDASAEGPGATPTVLFSDADAKEFSTGHRADSALRAGRHMRSLKT